MNNLGRNAAIIAGLVILVVGGAFAYIYISGGSGEASEEITAPTLPPREEVAVAEATDEPTAEATEVAVAEETEVAVAEETEVAVAEETEVAVAEETEVAVAEETEVAVAEETEEATAEIQTFSIIQAESTVRFKIQEDLRGNRITVVGETNEVAGLIEIDPVTPSNSRIGSIRVNMRTLSTDNDFRNRAIRSQILQTANDEFEFSDFIPSEVTGLPESVTIGEAFTFTVTGEFTIKGEPFEMTFEMEVTPVSETRIEGFGTATVFYKDLGLNIPNAPGVANISDEVILEIEFAAEAS